MKFIVNNGKPFARPPHFARRLLIMIIGVVMMALGLSILIRIDFGTDPCSALTLGIVSRTGISFGTCQLLCHLVTFIFVIRYDLSKIGFGTIGNMCFMGYISDFFSWVWEKTLPATLFEQTASRYVLLAVSLTVFTLGVSLYVSAGLGASPYDVLPQIISDHIKKVPFTVIRIAWDGAFMLGAFLLGGPIGLLTILLVLFLGPVIGFTSGKINRLFEDKTVSQ